jgi:predicted nucleic acid-binding protein
MIVVDASAVLAVLLEREAATVADRLFRSGESLHAPHLLDIETAQVVRRFSAKGQISDERGREALADFLDMPIVRYPHDVLLPRVWQLRANFSAYDAAYVALAEALNVPLVTRDRRLAGALVNVHPVELL